MCALLVKFLFDFLADLTHRYLWSLENVWKKYQLTANTELTSWSMTRTTFGDRSFAVDELRIWTLEQSTDVSSLSNIVHHCL